MSHASRATLSVLDLAPVTSGQDATHALRHSLDLAAEVDALGYRRIWFAEHHLTPGTASAAPAVLAALAAGRTSRIRVGTGAVLLAHTSAVAALEQLATVARLHPGRVDLGLGRAPGAPPATSRGDTGSPAPDPAAAEDQVRDGVVVPRPPRFRLTDPEVRETFAARQAVVGARADVPPFDEELRRALDLLAGGTTVGAHRYASPLAAGADVEIWPLASSGGESAQVAGRLGLPLVANYHVSPATVLDTVRSYRSAFTPGVLTEPYVAVSVDAVVAPTTEEARRLAAGYGHFVLSVRNLSGAEPYRTPDQAAARPLTAAERDLVHDRLVTQLVGTPTEVTDRLAALAALTGAAELLVTTITHDHAARVRSYRLLAEAWGLTPATSPQLTAVH